MYLQVSDIKEMLEKFHDDDIVVIMDAGDGHWIETPLTIETRSVSLVGGDQQVVAIITIT